MTVEVRDPMRITPRELSDIEKGHLRSVKQAGVDFYHLIERSVPAGRCSPIAITKIEEAVMWAVKGLTA